MTSEDFINWLNGFIEGLEVNNSYNNHIEIIKEKLSLIKTSDNKKLLLDDSRWTMTTTKDKLNG